MVIVLKFLSLIIKQSIYSSTVKKKTKNITHVTVHTVALFLKINNNTLTYVFMLYTVKSETSATIFEFFLNWMSLTGLFMHVLNITL